MKRLSILAIVAVAAGCGGGAPSLSGRFADVDHAPLAGATLVLFRASPLGAFREPGEKNFGTAVTGEDGRYRIEPPAGEYDLLIFYLDTTLHRRITVRGPTVVDQELSYSLSRAGKALECETAAAASCK
jgi:hypothetical protein